MTSALQPMESLEETTFSVNPIHTTSLSTGHDNSDRLPEECSEEDRDRFSGGGSKSGGAALGVTAAGPSLSNISDKSNGGDANKDTRSWSWVRKNRFLMRSNVREFIRECGGPAHVVFLTFTTEDNVTDKATFEKYLNSVLTGVLRKMCKGRYIAIRERQKRGAWHAHLLVYSVEDVRKGTCWGTDARGRFAVVRPGTGLQPWWQACKNAREKYAGLGRCSAEPVGKNRETWDIEGMCGYLSKYVTKYAEKRRRLVSHGRGWIPSMTSRCTMLTPWHAKWRVACTLYYNNLRKYGMSANKAFAQVYDRARADLSTFVQRWGWDLAQRIGAEEVGGFRYCYLELYSPPPMMMPIFDDATGKVHWGKVGSSRCGIPTLSPYTFDARSGVPYDSQEYRPPGEVKALFARLCLDNFEAQSAVRYF